MNPDKYERKDIYINYLAGILFVEYDPIADPNIINFCFSNKKIIKHSPMREEDVEKIINSVLQIEKKETIKEGDVVEVTEGDYKGIVGRIESIESAICKINVQIFGFDKTLEIMIDQIRVVDK